MASLDETTDGMILTLKNRRIVITGPESSGKSTLAAWLSQKFDLPMATEFARVYLEKHGPHYDETTVISMAQGHLVHQRKMVHEGAPLGIFDTDLLNYKIWCEVAFGSCDESILRGIARESRHVYLLCFPDLPWVADPLREYPNERMMLFDRHLTEIEATGRPYAVVRGQGAERENSALEGLRKMATC